VEACPVRNLEKLSLLRIPTLIHVRFSYPIRKAPSNLSQVLSIRLRLIHIRILTKLKPQPKVLTEKIIDHQVPKIWIMKTVPRTAIQTTITNRKGLIPRNSQSATTSLLSNPFHQSSRETPSKEQQWTSKKVTN
jgi:hypothetical protein